MVFSKAFEVCLKDVIAIIGSGGKTSLCYQIAKENTEKKVALTTTTKMLPVLKEEIGTEIYNFYGKNLPNTLCSGVNVFGEFFNTQKIASLQTHELEKLASLSEILVYEADGSKCKPLKAWKTHEPVILCNSTKVIGVVPLHVMEQSCDECLVHNFELFKKVFSVQRGTKIDTSLFAKIVDEMFKKVPKNCEKILYINRAQTQNDFLTCKKIALHVKGIKVFAGSIHEKTIREIR